MHNYIFNTSQYTALLESYNNIEGGNAESLIAMGSILMDDGRYVEGSKFVDLVNTALMHFKNTHPYEYKYIKGATVVYLLDDYLCDTMCVDGRMIYYINVGFLYNKPPYGLGMNALSVFKILYHEAMHTMLAHIERGHSYNENAQQKATWKELNIAGDLEINGMMVHDKICSDDFWDDIDGYYDKDLIGLPMETILKNNKQKIDAFKSARPLKKQGGEQKGNNKIPTSKAWKDGHKEGRELVRKLYKANGRNARKTLAEIGRIIDKHYGNTKKVAEELKKRFADAE